MIDTPARRATSPNLARFSVFIRNTASPLNEEFSVNLPCLSTRIEYHEHHRAVDGDLSTPHAGLPYLLELGTECAPPRLRAMPARHAKHLQS